jgi:hypothetical protein
MRHNLYPATALFALLAWLPAARADEVPAWAAPMRKVHEKFTGKPGTLALFGDSITVSRAFWSPPAGAPEDLPEPIAKNLAVVKKHMLDDCWSRWRGSEYGNEGRKTIRWAEENIDAWLKKLNPEAAVVMFGTNDLNELDAAEYDRRTRAVVEKCLKNGTVVILTTIPPRAGFEKKAAEFAEVQRKVADDLKLPLVDYHAKILKIRPDDWNGGLPKFKDGGAKDVYQVPTLISGDGVHPSNPAKFRAYTAESLANNGYLLRTVMTLDTYADVIREVFAKK